MMSSTKEQRRENGACHKRRHLNSLGNLSPLSIYLDDHANKTRLRILRLCKSFFFGFLRPFWFWSPFGLTQSSILQCPVRQHSSARPDPIRMWTRKTGIRQHKPLLVPGSVEAIQTYMSFEKRCAQGEENKRGLGEAVAVWPSQRIKV